MRTARNSYITGNFAIHITLLLEVVWNFIHIFVRNVLPCIFPGSLKTFVSAQSRLELALFITL